jgi:hypothetical protein
MDPWTGWQTFFTDLFAGRVDLIELVTSAFAYFS